LPLGTEEEVAGDPAGVTVERSESEKRRPDDEARNEPTRRVTIRDGASQRAIDAGRGGDTMRNPSRPSNAPEQRPDDSKSSGRPRYSDGHGQRWRLEQSAALPKCPTWSRMLRSNRTRNASRRISSGSSCPGGGQYHKSFRPLQERVPGPQSSGQPQRIPAEKGCAAAVSRQRGEGRTPPR
jgi:hypothetical protein